MSGVPYSVEFDDNYGKMLSSAELRESREADEEVMNENVPSTSTNPYVGLGSGAVPKRRSCRSDTQPDQMQKIAHDGIGIAGIILEQVISHPFAVLRRQCQVNRKSTRYHLTPLTLLPVAAKLIRRQGFGTMWKGAGSVFIIRGLSLATETALSDFMGFPREIFWYSSIKQLLQHAALKMVTCIIVTPFCAASLVETVQSSITSEKPGVLDCLKEGMFRIVQWGKPRSSRLLPVWLLIGPTLLHSVLHYVVSSLMHSTVTWYIKATRQHLEQTPEKAARLKRFSQNERFYTEMTSSLIGCLCADLLLYPMETILHRLYVQGTRSIIDNLDSGLAVTNVVTKYEGFFDCFQTIVEEEGAAGLYKGLGSVVMQYCLQVALLKGTKALLDQTMTILHR